MSKSAQEIRLSDEIYSQGTEIERTNKQYMRTLVPTDRPLEILDIGCGTGLNAKFLRDSGHTIVGVDLSPVAIEKFKAEGFEGCECDVAEGLPFDDQTFEFVYASEVIEHLGDPESFLREIYRVLKPGGKALISTINSAFWPFRVLGVLGYTATELQHPGHVRFFSIRSLKREVEEAGLKVDRVSARNMYIVFGDWIGKPLAKILNHIGFKREYRFATKTYFWHASHFSPRANSFFSDALIVQCTKPASDRSA